VSTFKLANYQSENGPRAAIIVDDQLYDAANLTDNQAYSSTLAILENWAEAEAELSQAVGSIDDKTTLADVKLLAPVLYPSAIYCCGANFKDHMDAVTKFHKLEPTPGPKELGVAPFFFLKSPRSVVGPDSKIDLWSESADFELELTAVIGREAHKVSLEDALDYVAGYTIGNDLSDRARILRPQLPAGSPFRYDWNSHKNFKDSCPLGPWIVPASEIPDPMALRMRTWVNDNPRQDSITGNMIFSLSEQIAEITKANVLYPGDLILTGTPKGVGAESATWLAKGDVIRMEIEKIGELITHVT